MSKCENRYVEFLAGVFIGHPIARSRVISLNQILSQSSCHCGLKILLLARGLPPSEAHVQAMDERHCLRIKKWVFAAKHWRCKEIWNTVYVFNSTFVMSMTSYGSAQRSYQ